MAGASTEWKQQVRAAFAAMSVGQTFTWRRTFSDGDLALFCGVTGDYNPYHIDATFASTTSFERPILPGLLTASMITHIGGMQGFLATEMHFEFVAPVFVGDTITCTVTIVGKDPEKRQVQAAASLVNQAGHEVVRAQFAGFPAQLRLAR